MTKTFTVYAAPIGKGRPRFTRGGRTYTPDKTRIYEACVRGNYISQCGNYKFPAGVPLSVHIVAFCPIPKSVSKKRRALMVGYPTITRPDVDNIAKAILDALNGAAFDDDAAVTALHVSKVYTDDEPRSVVSINELQECEV